MDSIGTVSDNVVQRNTAAVVKLVPSNHRREGLFAIDFSVISTILCVVLVDESRSNLTRDPNTPEFFASTGYFVTGTSLG